MIDRVLELVHALRASGIPVAVSESIDAIRSIEHVSLDDRESFRAALASTLTKSDTHRPAFDVLFDLYFGPGTRGLDEDAHQQITHDPERLMDDLIEALLAADSTAQAEAVANAVTAFGRVSGRTAGEWYSFYQVSRALELDGLVQRLMQRVPEEDRLDAIELRILRDSFERRVRGLRDALLAETRRRAVAQKGPEAVAEYATPALLEEMPVLTASEDELAALRRAIRPLARKLAARIAAKRRRARRGALDLRRTVRHSLSTGGVPFDTSFKHRVPHRPELFVICDVSGSVGRFSRFALMLVHALASQFSKVRSFAFVDTVDEVTRFFDQEDFVAAVDAMNRHANVVWLEAHSDYGNSLQRFLDDYGSDVGPRSTMLVFGDARNNYRIPNDEALKALQERARHIYWLNPEPIDDWDSGDSVASRYAAFVDRMVEVRNMKQLEGFIETVL